MAQAAMQGQGEPTGAANPVGGMPATDDEIREKYLERAIRELNTLTRDLQACEHCPRDHRIIDDQYARALAILRESRSFMGAAGWHGWPFQAMPTI